MINAFQWGLEKRDGVWFIGDKRFGIRIQVYLRGRVFVPVQDKGFEFVVSTPAQAGFAEPLAVFRCV
jgi:hypothetical protein